MAYYKTCPYCGSNLDPGEICDCMSKEAEAPEKGQRKVHILSFRELGRLIELREKQKKEA